MAIILFIKVQHVLFSLVLCGTRYLELGCYKDKHAKGRRPLPNLLFTDRDSKSQKFSGRHIDWGNLDAYMYDVVCRCAEQANAQGYMFFGLQFYGMS